MKKVVIALLIVFSWVSVANASPITDAINELNTSGKQSNAFVNHSVVDLTYLPLDGSVTIHTYMGADETLTVNNYTVLSQSVMDAHDKMTRFIFELINRYRPATDLALSGIGSLPTVHTWTYGAMKDEAMWAIVYGLEDCLNNSPYDWRDKYDDDGGNDSSYIDKYSPENIATTLSSIFTIGSTTYTLGKEACTMDVAPEVKGNRVFMPVRYVAYAVGVDQDGIKWDGDTETVTITKNDTTIRLTIGSTTQLVNDEPVEMDVAPYATQGRTMLPARWVSEPFGASVLWDETNQMVTIEVTEQGD